jgi:LPPG:FO 2-phospho-L-lactate transferase
MLERYGGPTWFRLGDQDIATNLLRTSMQRSGMTLTQITRHLSSTLGIKHNILPMCDQPVRTKLETITGLLSFQDYFVREKWQPIVREIRYEGAENAQPSIPVQKALAQASVVIFAPSNPFLSIDPILSIPGLCELIITGSAPCVAVSPVIGGQAVKGPTAKLMTELGYEVSSLGVAKHYEELIDGFILDVVDSSLCESIEALGIKTTVEHIFMETLEHKTDLSNKLMNWIEETFT